LQGKAAEDQSNTESSQPALRKVICVVFDVRSDGLSDTGHQAGYNPHSNRERQIHVMNESATEQSRGEIADCAEGRAPKLATRQVGMTSSRVVHAWTYATGVGKYLAHRDESGEYAGKSEADNRVESDSYSDTTNCREQAVQRQGMPLHAAGYPVEFDGQRNA
jgi:hypothetical protein